MRRKHQPVQRVDTGMLILGLLIGATAGALFGLFKAPRSGAATRKQLTRGLTETGESIREKLDIVTADPVSESIAEGKAAAHRRRVQFGLIGPETARNRLP